MKDELNITLRIGELPPVALTIERADEEVYRSAEYSVEHLWNLLRRRFPEKNITELLGLVALQFARRSIISDRALAEARSTLELVEGELDGLLELTMPPAAPQPAPQGSQLQPASPLQQPQPGMSAPADAPGISPEPEPGIDV